MKVTNYEIIKQFDLEELASLLDNFHNCQICTKNANVCRGKYCKKEIEKWLKKPAKNNLLFFQEALWLKRKHKEVK